MLQENLLSLSFFLLFIGSLLTPLGTKARDSDLKTRTTNPRITPKDYQKSVQGKGRNFGKERDGKLRGCRTPDAHSRITAETETNQLSTQDRSSL